MEQEQSENNKSTQRSIQDYLSLGYLYLLVLGVISDSVRYGFLGINIINYSNVLDVLLSPVVYLTKDTLIPIVFFGVALLITGIVYGSKWYFDKNKDKESFQKRKNFAKLEKNYVNFQPVGGILTLLALFILGGYLGFGIGGGTKLSKGLKAGNLGVDTQLTFINDDTLNVKLIGHNSQYFFYAEDSAKVVTIMPIQGNIKKIENLE